MSTKVTQMIELLFRDLQPSEEVQALHDEVLNNCQERFDDLVRNHLSEEEALTAVMESLKGMEDVLKDYPRKEMPQPEAPGKEDPATAAPETAGRSIRRFSPEGLREINIQLAGCDLEIRPGKGEVALECPARIQSVLEEGGILRIWQDRPTEKIFQGIAWEESFNSFERFGDAMNRLAQNVSQLISGTLSAAGREEENRATLYLPANLYPEVRIQTTGGDISWESVLPGKSMTLGSTSGDIRVKMDESFLVPEVQVSTTSGDVEVRVSAEEARINSVSGDLAWVGDAGNLEINSTSGDAEVRGRLRRVRMKSTSGDLNLTLSADEPAEVLAETVSGDIALRLPEAVSEISAALKTVSGNVLTRGIDLAEDASIQVEANTISGNLRISR